MKCIEIEVNGVLRWRAGIENASMLTPMVHGSMAGDAPAGVRVAGMCDLPGDRAAHVHWAHDDPLRAGDTVVFRFADADDPSPPAEVTATDSPEYLEEQRQFAEIERNYVPGRTPMSREYPNLIFQCRLTGQDPVAARFVEDEEHILCSVDWNKWRPDQCRIFVRSFGGALLPDEKEPTEWLRGRLAPGESFELRVAV